MYRIIQRNTHISQVDKTSFTCISSIPSKVLFSPFVHFPCTLLPFALDLLYCVCFGESVCRERGALHQKKRKKRKKKRNPSDWEKFQAHFVLYPLSKTFCNILITYNYYIFFYLLIYYLFLVYGLFFYHSGRAEMAANMYRVGGRLLQPVFLI